MAFFGILLMIYGFGGLIANYFFGKDFGLLSRWFEGGTLTVVSAAAGVVGLVLVLFSDRKKKES
jgi:hypothetical protein